MSLLSELNKRSDKIKQRALHNASTEKQPVPGLAVFFQTFEQSRIPSRSNAVTRAALAQQSGAQVVVPRACALDPDRPNHCFSNLLPVTLTTFSEERHSLIRLLTDAPIR